MRVRLTEHRAGVTARRGIDRRPTLWRRLGLPLLAWSAIVLLGCGEGLLAQDQTQQLMQRAEELYQAGRYAESREKANFAVQRAPENPRALFLRGRAALAMGDATVALQDLTTAQKLDPTLGFAANRPAFEQSLQQAETQAGPGAVSPPATPPAGTPPADLQAPPPAGGTAPTTPGTPSQPGMPNATATPGAAAPGAAPGTAPGTPPGTPPAALPTTPAVPAPTGDPVVDALRTPGSQVLDFAQPPAFTPEQTAALENLFTLPPSPEAQLKLLALPAGQNPTVEAKRLFEAAGLTERDLLVVGVPGMGAAGYNPLLDPNSLAAAQAQSTVQPEAPLAEQMRIVTEALAPLLGTAPVAPPAGLPPPEVALPSPGVNVGPIQPPAAAPPAALPLWLWGVYTGVAVLVLGLAWLTGARLLAGRRLSRGFGAASPRVGQVADQLTALARVLQLNPNRQAATAHEAAELAFFDALAMMAKASDKDTGDIGRVERANRLLDEAAAKLDEAAAAAGAAPTPPAAGAIPLACYFTAQPIFDRHDADVVELIRGEQRRTVLASRQLSDTLRRGGRPAVRVVRRGDQVLHWARVPEFEPAYDYYHADRHGNDLAELNKLADPLFDDAAFPVFVDAAGRPDYRLTLPPS